MPLQYGLDPSSDPILYSQQSQQTARGKATIDRRRDRYPFSIVWGPLPLIR